MKNHALAWLVVALLINTAYVAAFADPTIFYMGNVVLHVLLGLAVTAVALFNWRNSRISFLAISALTGIALVVIGNTFPHRWLLWTHIAVSLIFVAAIAPWFWRLPAWRAFAAAAALLVLAPALTALYRKTHPDPQDRIRNPLLVP